MLRKLAAGGMGVVYLAEQTSLKRQVALKVVRPELLLSASARERFQREVETVGHGDVPHGAPGRVGKLVGQYRPAAERLHRHRGDELAGRFGHHHLHCRASLGQLACQLRRLVAGDAAGESEHDVAAVEWQFALLAPELSLAVATAATSPPPSALREQTDAVMTLVGRMVQAAL